MKITIDCDFDAETLSRLQEIIRSDLLPWEKGDSDSMEHGHGYVLQTDIDCFEAMRRGVVEAEVAA
jgi:hypothetical protein